jgi:ssRNA-specific RNase YbeY (16S rRNA maturation enzyme)
MDVTIHPSSNEFIVKNATVACHREPRRVSCLLVDKSKMDKILIKQSRNKKNPADVFLISLQFKEDLEKIKSDFGEQFDKQLKQLILTEFADVTEEPEGLPPHRGMLDH